MFQLLFEHSLKLNCPLCLSDDIGAFFHDRRRPYARCRSCALICVPPAYFLSPEAEKAEYDLHRNTPDDRGYRKFLQRVFKPLNERLLPHSRGLDFGSGPGPTLSVMFEEAGHSMTLYDRFYAADTDAVTQTYDFITATEVFEHLHQPRQELERLWGCLKPGGILGVMTKLARDREAFAGWHYIRDLTHVSFFSEITIHWLASHWQAPLTRTDSDVFLFRKNPKENC